VNFGCALQCALCLFYIIFVFMSRAKISKVIEVTLIQFYRT